MIAPSPEIRKKTGKLLILIDPYPEDNPYRMNPQEMKVIWFPKLSLPVIASRTPGDWDIRIVDESQIIVRKEWVDEVIRDRGNENILVGISTQMTCYTPRAYEIAALFRERGVKVCLGGTHATYLPEEAARHADTVVKFEADEIWPDVIADFEKGSLKPLYEMSSYPTMENYPYPRIDMLPRDSYMTTQCIQTTRGCHFECEFCSVSPFNGKSSRRRSVECVLSEIQRIKEWHRDLLVEGMVQGPMLARIGTGLKILLGVEDGSLFAFVDDLHNSNRDYCKKLWRALKEMNIKWGAQCTLFLGDDPGMVKLAAESGCIAMFVGLESINQEALIRMKKGFNRENNYAAQIQCFHDHGIMVQPGIIFGSDEDDESVFESTVDFLIKARVESAYINIATPLPGTALFDRLKADNRIFDWDWSHYDGKYVVYRPMRMTPEALQEGFFWANRKFFSIPSIITRMSATRKRLIPRWIMNWQFRKLIHRTCPPGKLAPMAKVLKKIPVQFPSLDTGNLIPNGLEKAKGSVQGATARMDRPNDRFLKIKVKRQEDLSILQIELEGTLDRINVTKLKKRVLQAARKAKMDIVINFEHLRYAAPEALLALLDWKALKRLPPAVQIKVMNLSASFKETVQSLSLAGREVSKEKLL